MQYHHEDIWPLTFFIDIYDFLNQQGKITMKPRWQFTCNKSLLKFATMLGVIRWPWYHHLNLKGLYLDGCSTFPKWWVCLNDITFFLKSSIRVNTPISKHYDYSQTLAMSSLFLVFPFEIFMDMGTTNWSSTKSF